MMTAGVFLDSRRSLKCNEIGRFQVITRRNSSILMNTYRLFYDTDFLNNIELTYAA